MDIHGFSQSFRPFDLRSSVGFMAFRPSNWIRLEAGNNAQNLGDSTGDWVASGARKNAVKAVKPMELYITRA